MITDVEQLVIEIETLDLEGLRDVWRERYGAPPPLRSAPIMRQLLAWRVQAQALGGLDAIVGRFEKAVLERLYSEHPSSRQLGKRLGVSHTTIANKLREHAVGKAQS